MPEEFWGDFDDIVGLLDAAARAIEARVVAAAASVAQLSDKELGLTLAAQTKDVRPYLFGLRETGAVSGKLPDTLMRSIRPNGNVLPGYIPSFAMNRVLEDALG